VLRERERERKKKPREEKLLCLLSGFFSFGFLHFNPSICFYLALGHCNYNLYGYRFYRLFCPIYGKDLKISRKYFIARLYSDLQNKVKLY
jgi:hypothetical protein